MHFQPMHSSLSSDFIDSYFPTLWHICLHLYLNFNLLIHLLFYYNPFFGRIFLYLEINSSSDLVQELWRRTGGWHVGEFSKCEKLPGGGCITTGAAPSSSSDCSCLYSEPMLAVQLISIPSRHRRTNTILCPGANTTFILEQIHLLSWSRQLCSSVKDLFPSQGNEVLLLSFTSVSQLT